MSDETIYDAVPVDAPGKKAARPYFNMWVADWLSSEAVTMMTPEQEGGFFRLLLLSWRADPPCTLPNDQRVLAKLSRLDRRWKKAGPLIVEQFDEVENGTRLRNPRLYSVFCEMVKKQGQHVSAGRDGGLASAEKRRSSVAQAALLQRAIGEGSVASSDGAAKAKHSYSYSYSYSDSNPDSSLTTGERSPAGTAEVEPAGFADAWADYPARGGGNARPAALRAYRARLNAGVAPAELAAGARRYAAYCQATKIAGTRFVKQAATFFGPDAHYAEPWDAPEHADAPADGISEFRRRHVVAC